MKTTIILVMFWGFLFLFFLTDLKHTIIIIHCLCIYFFYLCCLKSANCSKTLHFLKALFLADKTFACVVCLTFYFFLNTELGQVTKFHLDICALISKTTKTSIVCLCNCCMSVWVCDSTLSHFAFPSSFCPSCICKHAHSTYMLT